MDGATLTGEEKTEQRKMRNLFVFALLEALSPKLIRYLDPVR